MYFLSDKQSCTSSPMDVDFEVQDVEMAARSKKCLADSFTKDAILSNEKKVINLTSSSGRRLSQSERQRMSARKRRNSSRRSVSFMTGLNKIENRQAIQKVEDEIDDGVWRLPATPKVLRPKSECQGVLSLNLLYIYRNDIHENNSVCYI